MNDYPPGLYFHMKVKTHPKSSGLVRMLYDVFSTNCVSVLLRYEFQDEKFQNKFFQDIDLQDNFYQDMSWQKIDLKFDCHGKVLSCNQNVLVSTCFGIFLSCNSYSWSNFSCKKSVLDVVVLVGTWYWSQTFLENKRLGKSCIGNCVLQNTILE